MRTHGLLYTGSDYHLRFGIYLPRFHSLNEPLSVPDARAVSRPSSSVRCSATRSRSHQRRCGPARFMGLADGGRGHRTARYEAVRRRLGVCGGGYVVEPMGDPPRRSACAFRAEFDRLRHHLLWLWRGLLDGRVFIHD
jgi:hypothetical protein